MVLGLLGDSGGVKAVAQAPRVRGVGADHDLEAAHGRGEPVRRRLSTPVGELVDQPGSQIRPESNLVRRPESNLVHPTRLHTNPQPVIEGPLIAVAAVHARVRRQ